MTQSVSKRIEPHRPKNRAKPRRVFGDLQRFCDDFQSLRLVLIRGSTRVLILDEVNSEKGEHVRSNLSYLICFQAFDQTESSNKSDIYSPKTFAMEEKLEKKYGFGWFGEWLYMKQTDISDFSFSVSYRKDTG